jgi:hypothetical protein
MGCGETKRSTETARRAEEADIGSCSHPPNAVVPRTAVRVQESVRVRGLLSPEGIARIARRRIDEPRACSWEELDTLRGLRGPLTMGVSISRSGEVSSARIRGGSLRDEGMRACVRDTVGRWTF